MTSGEGENPVKDTKPSMQKTNKFPQPPYFSSIGTLGLILISQSKLPYYPECTEAALELLHHVLPHKAFNGNVSQRQNAIIALKKLLSDGRNFDVGLLAEGLNRIEGLTMEGEGNQQSMDSVRALIDTQFHHFKYVRAYSEKTMPEEEYADRLKLQKAADENAGIQDFFSPGLNSPPYFFGDALAGLVLLSQNKARINTKINDMPGNPVISLPQEETVEFHGLVQSAYQLMRYVLPKELMSRKDLNDYALANITLKALSEAPENPDIQPIIEGIKSARIRRNKERYTPSKDIDVLNREIGKQLDYFSESAVYATPIALERYNQLADDFVQEYEKKTAKKLVTQILGDHDSNGGKKPDEAPQYNESKNRRIIETSIALLARSNGINLFRKPQWMASEGGEEHLVMDTPAKYAQKMKDILANLGFDYEMGSHAKGSRILVTSTMRSRVTFFIKAEPAVKDPEWVKHIAATADEYKKGFSIM